MRCLPCLCLFHLHMAAQVSHLLDAEAVSSRKLQVVWHTFTRKHHGATSRGCPLRPHPTDSLLPVYLHPCFVFLLLHALQEDPGRCVPSLATWNVRKYCVWRLRQKQGDGVGRCLLAVVQCASPSRKRARGAYVQLLRVLAEPQ